MQKIMVAGSTSNKSNVNKAARGSNKVKVSTSTSASKEANNAAMVSQRSRNYKFKMGTGAVNHGGHTTAGKLNNNSGISLLGHHSTVVGSSGMTAVGTVAPGGNNYNMGGATNFGLGAIGNLAGLGGGSYLTKGEAINTSGNISSAYATNASDLIRGFKSSQSLISLRTRSRR